MLNGKIVRALDVGYGNVKFVREHNSIEAPVVCNMFPSFSPTASSKNIGEGTLIKRDTVVVEVNGVKYEVGPDVIQARGANSVGPAYDTDFVRTDGYYALVLGALDYMFQGQRENYIDLLVVGLPVNKMSENKEFLINMLTGNHVVSEGREVKVKEVKVFEQPLGAFFNFMFSPEESDKYSFQEVKSQRNLIIDPGMYTFDWLLIDNMRGVGERSGSANGSMSEFIKAMSTEISTQKNENEDEIFNILDEAIRLNKVPVIYNKPVDIDDYTKHGTNIVNTSVNLMGNKLGKAANINNIMLVGGGARFFLKAIQDKFPNHTIITTNNSVYANVIGFQLAGERYLLKEQVATRKSSLASV